MKATVLVESSAIDHAGTAPALHGGMSDARQSPIPQDRVNENVDQAQLAEDDRRLAAEQERYLADQARKPGAPDDEGPGEGGD